MITDGETGSIRDSLLLLPRRGRPCPIANQDIFWLWFFFFFLQLECSRCESWYFLFWSKLLHLAKSFFEEGPGYLLVSSLFLSLFLLMHSLICSVLSPALLSFLHFNLGSIPQSIPAYSFLLWAQEWVFTPDAVLWLSRLPLKLFIPILPLPPWSVWCIHRLFLSALLMYNQP